MTLTLTGLLALNAALHAAILARFGLRGNVPPAVFGLLYLALAAALYSGMAYALWGVLLVAVVGSLGLIANYRKIDHEKTLENAILVLNAVLLVLTILQLRA